MYAHVVVCVYIHIHIPTFIQTCTYIENIIVLPVYPSGVRLHMSSTKTPPFSLIRRRDPAPAFNVDNRVFPPEEEVPLWGGTLLCLKAEGSALAERM